MKYGKMKSRSFLLCGLFLFSSVVHAKGNGRSLWSTDTINLGQIFIGQQFQTDLHQYLIDPTETEVSFSMVGFSGYSQLYGSTLKVEMTGGLQATVDHYTIAATKGEMSELAKFSISINSFVSTPLYGSNLIFFLPTPHDHQPYKFNLGALAFNFMPSSKPLEFCDYDGQMPCRNAGPSWGDDSVFRKIGLIQGTPVATTLEYLDVFGTFWDDDFRDYASKLPSFIPKSVDVSQALFTNPSISIQKCADTEVSLDISAYLSALGASAANSITNLSYAMNDNIPAQNWLTKTGATTWTGHLPKNLGSRTRLEFFSAKLTGASDDTQYFGLELNVEDCSTPRK